MNNSHALVHRRAFSEESIVHIEKQALVFCQEWKKLQTNSSEVEER